MSPAGLGLSGSERCRRPPAEVRARGGDRQRGRGRLSPVRQPWGTVGDNRTAAALLALPLGTAAVPGPRVRVAWPAGQPEAGLSCLQTGFSPVRPRCLSPRLLRGRVPFPGDQAGSTRSPRLRAGIPRLRGLVRIPWRRQCSPLCRWEQGGSMAPAGARRVPGLGSPLPLWPGSALRRGKEEIGCVQMVSVKRSQFLLSPPLSPVTSSVISVSAGLRGLPHQPHGPGTRVLPALGATRSCPPRGVFLGCQRGSFGAGRLDCMAPVSRLWELMLCGGWAPTRDEWAGGRGVPQ